MTIVDFEGARVPDNPLWVSSPLRFAAARALSENKKSSGKAVAPIVRQLRQTGRALAQVSKAPKLERARIIVIVKKPDGRRRDVLNLNPTVKPIIDGFVDYGLLPDDDWEHLEGPDFRGSRLRSEPSLLEPMLEFRFLAYGL